MRTRIIGLLQVLLLALAFVLGVEHGVNYEPSNNCQPNAPQAQETID